MKKKLRCYLIAPETQTVIEMLINPENYDLKRELLGCDVCCTVYPAPNLILWLDDESLLKDPVPGLWQIRGYDGVLAGKGLLVGLDRDRGGEHMACPYPREIIEASVTWRPYLEFAGMETETGTEKHPIFGKMSTITTRAKFRPKGN